MKAIHLPLAFACFAVFSVFDANAQSYRGRRAGNVTARGYVASCNMAGTVFMEVG